MVFGVSGLIGIAIIFVVLWLLVAIPAFRYFILVLVVSVGLGFGLRVAYALRQERLPLQVIPSDQVELTDIRLASSRGSYRLSGKIENLSQRYTLRDVHLEVTLYDCPPPSRERKVCPHRPGNKPLVCERTPRAHSRPRRVFRF